MPKVEVTHEPAPAPKAHSKLTYEVGAHIRFMRDGKEIGSIKTPPFKRNERRLREQRKY